MKSGRGLAITSSALTIDSDLDFLGLYQVTNLAAPASGEALRKGNMDIANAEVANAAAIAESKLDIAIPVFTELAGDEAKAVSSNDTWEAWDISSIVPVGTKAVLVIAVTADSVSANEPVGARQNGGSLDRSFGPWSVTAVISEANVYQQLGPMLTEVDANRVIEIYAGSALISFGIKGYWS